MKKVKHFLKKFILYIYIRLHTLMINIGIALYHTEMNVFKTGNLFPDEMGKKIIRARHRNKLLEKFYAGNKDEKYVQDYYELLKKADKFMRNATVGEMELSAYKHGMNMGRKDIKGRIHDHVGFFDNQHKNVGKTMGEVLNDEMNERASKDDEYKIIKIFNNTPIEKIATVSDAYDEKTNKVDLNNVVKNLEFPIVVERDNKDIFNKIEQLTEFLHVKEIGFEYRQLEFFIPLKFKIDKVENDSDTFKELTDIKSVMLKEKYGESTIYSIKEFTGRAIYDNYEVWKFYGTESEKLIIH